MAATRRAESEDDETADTPAHLGEVARTARREDDLMDVTMARSRRHEHGLILVLNCGSSSIKFAVFDSSAAPLPRQALWNGKVQGIGGANPDFGETGVAPFSIELDTAHPYRAALRLIRDRVSRRLDGRRVGAVAHRIVHGGEKYTSSVVIDDSVIQGIKDAASFAPLHNPAHLIGIAEALKSFPNLKDKNVAVFDTAFHQTMPEESYLYALPYSLYKEHGVRRYGAHGTSHFYVTQEAAKVLNKPVEELNIITCHLGNGGSVSAIRNGKCVDTSMGLTPLEGLVMGTRSGDIDPAIIFHLHDTLGMSVDQINKMLTKESGLLGLTEVTSDCRYVEDNYADERRR